MQKLFSNVVMFTTLIWSNGVADQKTFFNMTLYAVLICYNISRKFKEIFGIFFQYAIWLQVSMLECR